MAPHELVPQDGSIIPEPDLEPEWVGTAEVILPSDIFAEWMNKIRAFLAKAENGEDFKSYVVLAGYDSRRKPKFKVTWKSKTQEGVKYLNSMALTFRVLEHDKKQLEDKREEAS